MAKSRKKKRRVGNAVVFALTFLLFLIVFGGLCLWAVIRMNEERIAGSSSDDSGFSAGSSVGAFSTEDIRNLLIITVDNEEAQGFVSLQLNPMDRSVKVAAFPRDTVVEQAAEEVLLHEVYAARGAASARDALAKAAQCTFDNYVVFTYTSLKKIVDELGNGVLMELGETLSYHDEILDIELRSGYQYLTSAQALDVLRYPSWRSGRKQRADVQAQLFMAMINQYLREGEDIDGDFTMAVNNALTTDIRRQHFHDAKEGISYLMAQNTGSVCTMISVEGGYVGSGDAMRFVLSETASR